MSESGLANRGQLLNYRIPSIPLELVISLAYNILKPPFGRGHCYAMINTNSICRAWTVFGVTLLRAYFRQQTIGKGLSLVSLILKSNRVEWAPPPQIQFHETTSYYVHAIVLVCCLSVRSLVHGSGFFFSFLTNFS